MFFCLSRHRRKPPENSFAWTSCRKPWNVFICNPSAVFRHEHLNLAIGLPLRNEQALDDLLQQIYDPASPNFRHYLTPEQFTEQFGPTEQDYQAVIDFAKANGLTVTGTHPNRVVLDVSGSVADIERVFM